MFLRRTSVEEVLVSGSRRGEEKREERSKKEGRDAGHGTGGTSDLPGVRTPDT